MLRDALFSQESSADELELARALLAERSAEEIAAALARLYRARLPSPEDLLDPGEKAGRSREVRGRDKDDRAARGDDRAAAPRARTGKSPSRHGMAEGSVWFRAAIGRQNKAEARWLLPMICRRGGIDKNDIGAIRILDTTTEFEISERAADEFAIKVRRPDKEDNIRIEPLQGSPQARAERRSPAPWRETSEADRGAHRNDKPRDERAPKPHRKPHGEGGPRFEEEAGFKKSRRSKDRPAYAGSPQHAAARTATPAFANKKKAKKNRRG
jgi:ATP-dependent RNA helicase DeaD